MHILPAELQYNTHNIIQMLHCNISLSLENNSVSNYKIEADTVISPPFVIFRETESPQKIQEVSIQTSGYQLIQKYFYHQRKREACHSDEQLPVKDKYTQGQTQ